MIRSMFTMRLERAAPAPYSRSRSTVIGVAGGAAVRNLVVAAMGRSYTGFAGFRIVAAMGRSYTGFAGL